MSLLLGVALCCMPQGGPPAWEPPVLVPPARVVQPRRTPWVVPAETRVVATQPELEALAGVVAAELSERMGVEIPAVGGIAKSGDFVLSTGGSYVDQLPTDEGFAIEVYGDHLAVMGKGPAGVARGAARMLQLGEFDPEEKTAVFPAIYVQDWPELGWRGVPTIHPAEVEESSAESTSDPIIDALDDAFLLGFNRVVYAGEPRLSPEETEGPLAERLARYSAYAEARSIAFAHLRSFSDDPRVVLWNPQLEDRPVPGAGDTLIHLVLCEGFGPGFAGGPPEGYVDVGIEIEKGQFALRELGFGLSGVLFECGAQLPDAATTGDRASYRTKMATYAWTGALPQSPVSAQGADPSK